MNDDDFGVRWTGYLSAPVTGTYQLGAIGMNAFELYLDGKRIVDFNNIHERSYRYEQVKLEAGKLYQIRLDYHEFLNDADIQLVWSRARRSCQARRNEAWSRGQKPPMPWCWCSASRRASKARR